MPAVSDMFPSKWISGVDLGDKNWTLTIDRVELVEVFVPPATKAKKWAVFFQGARKGLILYLTNAKSITLICGSEDTDDWNGLRVTLYPKPVRVGKDTKIGVRIRKPENGQDAPPEALDDDPGDF